MLQHFVFDTVVLLPPLVAGGQLRCRQRANLAATGEPIVLREESPAKGGVVSETIYILLDYQVVTWNILRIMLANTHFAIG